jgi:hypothetical protein
MTTHVPSASLSATTAAATRTDDATRVARASWVLLVSGLGFTAAAVFAPAVLQAFYDLVATGGTVTLMEADARLGAALFGALTFGWGVTLQQLGRGARLVHATTVGALSWFVVDSAASVALGYGWNALSNLGFVVMILALLGRRRG